MINKEEGYWCRVNVSFSRRKIMKSFKAYLKLTKMITICILSHILAIYYHDMGLKPIQTLGPSPYIFRHPYNQNTKLIQK